MEQNNKKQPIRVGIIGAGIAGCCLAIGLLQNPSLDVQLYEAYPEIKVRGSGLALHGNAIRAMDLISPKIKTAYFQKSHYMANEEDIEMATQFIISSGEHAGVSDFTLVAELGRAKGRRTVHRAHFIQGLLEEAIPDSRIHFGKRVRTLGQDALSGKVTATFENGAQETFDVLFGAEGVNSTTRKFILGHDHPAANPVNHDRWRQFRKLGGLKYEILSRVLEEEGDELISDLDRDVPMEIAKHIVKKEQTEKVVSYCTPVGMINGIQVDLGKTFGVEYYRFQLENPAAARKLQYESARFCSLSKKEKKRREERNGLTHLHTLERYLPKLDTLISLLEKDAREDWALQDHDHAPTYFKGHIAMIGDAAHATLPHAGNGAAQALEDCAILTGVFSKVESCADIKPALRAFDEIRRPRSQKVIDITRLFSKLYSKDAEEIDLATMRSQMQEGGRYTNGVDMEVQVQSAIDAFDKYKAQTG
ncbi:hypothetical protein GGR57DRAFT_500144 [Xylariaceae sp. FL1272]|nr:hypothetical protein GGR57DRAFT_500144 [Xylariaceae sp. FL1272]